MKNRLQEMLLAQGRRVHRYFGCRFHGSARRFGFLYAPLLVAATVGGLASLHILVPVDPGPETAAPEPPNSPPPTSAPAPSPAPVAPAPSPAGPEDHFAAGRNALEARNFAEAESRFRLALAGAPGQAASANNLAVALIAQKRFAEAADVLSTLLQAHPGDIGARSNRAFALRAEGRLAEALAEMAVAAEADAFNPLVVNRFLLMRLQNGEESAVRALIEQRTKTGLPTVEAGHIVAEAALLALDGDLAACRRRLGRAARLLDRPTFNLLLDDPVFLPFQAGLLSDRGR
jgi:hypothetical protein